MRWLSIDSPLTYASVYRSEDGAFEIHHLEGGSGIYIARVYNAREAPGAREVKREFAGPRALEQAQRWVKERV